jgi:antitoxin component of MazEF toxin-antitoxin module
MNEIEVVGPVRKMGNSLAVVIPSKDAKRAHITEGVPVRARVSVEVPRPFGLLKGVAKGSFDRKKEGLWRDRL